MSLKGREREIGREQDVDSGPGVMGSLRLPGWMEASLYAGRDEPVKAEFKYKWESEAKGHKRIPGKTDLVAD